MTHIPCLQCSDWRATSIQPSSVVGVVAGITIVSPEGRETVISFLKHLGMDKVKKLVLVVVDVDLFSDSDTDVDLLFDFVSESDSLLLIEVPSLVEVLDDLLVPLCVV